MNATAYPTVDTTTDMSEKKVIECIGCARIPIARMVVSKKKRVYLMITYLPHEGLHVQAPDCPTTPMRATLESIFEFLKFCENQT